MLSSRSFIVLPFTFRSMTHIELIFVQGRDPSLFFSSPVASQWFHPHLLKRSSFLPLNDGIFMVNQGMIHLWMCSRVLYSIH